MARPMTPVAVGRVNRRFLALALILAVLSAVLAYAALSKSGDGGTSAVDVSVVVAAVDIDARTQITADMLEVTQFPDTQLPSGAVTNIEDLVGKVTKVYIAAREPVLTSKFVDINVPLDEGVLAYVVEAGKRGMAIKTVQVTSVGGLVLPGDHVDLLWIPKDSPDDVRGGQLLAENVEVLAVQQTVLDIAPTAPGVQEPVATATAVPSTTTSQRIRDEVPDPVPEAITVVLMLTPRQASNVFCGDAGGGEIRLALRAFGDNSPSGLTPVDCVVLGKDTLNQQ